MVDNGGVKWRRRNGKDDRMKNGKWYCPQENDKDLTFPSMLFLMTVFSPLYEVIINPFLSFHFFTLTMIYLEFERHDRL